MSHRLDQLPNGVRVVTEAMPGLQSASIGIWVDAGGRHERPEENGVAHFLEHMAFKGTRRRTALQIAEAIEDVGGYINAYTSKEQTAYYARVLEADVPLALDVLADIVLNPVFNRADIEVERGVILQEIGQAIDTPDDVIFDWLQEAAFHDQALGRPILGPAERVATFGRGDLAGFVGAHYRPERMIVAAAGAVDHDAILAQAGELFSAPSAPAGQRAERAHFTRGERREVKDLEQVHLALGFEGPGYRDEGFYAAQVLATALGGGMSSRLFQEIREKRGLCYSIFAQGSAYSDTGMTTIYAGTSADQIGALARLTSEELRRAAEDMSAAEIDRARAQMKAGMLMGLESPAARAERLARMLSIWGRVPEIGEIVAQVDAVDLEAVRQRADALRRAPVALALYGEVATAPGLEEIGQWLSA